MAIIITIMTLSMHYSFEKIMMMLDLVAVINLAIKNTSNKKHFNLQMSKQEIIY